jgi:hypothetical protein
VIEARSLFIAAALALPTAPPACALNFFELEVYPATTEGKGIHELENTTSFVANGNAGTAEEGDVPRHRLLRTSIEYNYGLTDKIDVATYLDLQRPNEGDVEYAGSRVRARGALWEKGQYPVDLGWYVEAEMPHDAPSDLEFDFRPLLSRDLGRFSVDLNPGFELPTVTSERRTLEFSYAARVYYRLSRNLTPGVEFYGSIGQIRAIDPSREQEHYVFPVLYGRLARSVNWVVGPGFGLTRGSDPVLLKLGIEYEFTLGGRGGSTRPPY